MIYKRNKLNCKNYKKNIKKIHLLLIVKSKITKENSMPKASNAMMLKSSTNEKVHKLILSKILYKNLIVNLPLKMSSLKNR